MLHIGADHHPCSEAEHTEQENIIDDVVSRKTNRLIECSVQLEKCNNRSGKRNASDYKAGNDRNKCAHFIHVMPVFHHTDQSSTGSSHSVENGNKLRHFCHLHFFRGHPAHSSSENDCSADESVDHRGNFFIVQENSSENGDCHSDRSDKISFTCCFGIPHHL